MRNISDKKIPGFTLVEVLMVMVLSSLVIAITYKGLDIVTDLMNAQVRQNQAINTTMSIQNLLDYESLCSSYCEVVDERELRFINGEKITSLSFGPDLLLIKKDNMTDSIDLKKCRIKNLFFCEFRDPRLDNKIVKSARVTFQIGEYPCSLIFDKEYDCKTLLKLESGERDI